MKMADKHHVLLWHKLGHRLTPGTAEKEQSGLEPVSLGELLSEGSKSTCCALYQHLAAWVQSMQVAGFKQN